MSAGWIYLRKDASAYYIGQTSSPSSRDCVYRKENAAVSTIDIYHVDDMDGVENELMDALSDYQFFPDNGRRNETFVLDSRVPATYFAIKAKHEGAVGNNESVTKAAIKAAQERDAAIAELNSLKKSVDENNQRKRDAELAAKKKQEGWEKWQDDLREFIFVWIFMSASIWAFAFACLFAWSLCNQNGIIPPWTYQYSTPSLSAVFSFAPFKELILNSAVCILVMWIWLWLAKADEKGFRLSFVVSALFLALLIQGIGPTAKKEKTDWWKQGPSLRVPYNHASAVKAINKDLK